MRYEPNCDIGTGRSGRSGAGSGSPERHASGNGKGTYDTTTHGTDTALDGSVNFNAHGGVLDITISDVKVSTSGAAGAVTVDLKTPEGTADDVAFAELDLSAARPGQGEGTALDPATLSVKAVTPPAEEPTEEPTQEPTQEPTGKPTATPTGKPTTPASRSPSASVTTPAVEQGDLVDGTLDRGVKDSFRTYVTGPIAKGEVETTGGATASDSGYRFPDATGSFDADEQALYAEFDGKVRFLGHKEDDAYTLDLSFTGLEVQVKDGKGTLVADVSSKDRETRKVTTYTDLAVADLKLPGGELAPKDGVVTLSAVPATLTAAGTEAFGGMYAEGTKLDALTVSVALDADAELPGVTGGTGGTGGPGTTTGGGSTTGGTVGGGTVGGSGALASTGAGVPAGALIAGSGVVVAAGAAVVIAARRRRTV